MSPARRDQVAMGSSQSKAGVERDAGEQLSLLTEMIMNKYGPESCAYVGLWCKQSEFPEGGSLSPRQSSALRDNLTRKKNEMMNRKKPSTKELHVLVDIEV